MDTIKENEMGQVSISQGVENEKSSHTPACRLDSSCKQLLRGISNDSKMTLQDLLDKNKFEEEEHSENKANIVNLIDQGYKPRKIAVSVFNLVLEDWMYSFKNDYDRADYRLLFNRIADLVVKGLPLKFFIPGFPCKSPNREKKVLGVQPDFAEFLAIRLLLGTARKIEALYPKGVLITIMSDYHTFDEYIGVNEEDYRMYHDGLKKLIHDAGADDVIELISLSNFPEFKDTPQSEISRVLSEKYGGSKYMANFDDTIKQVTTVLEKYMQMRKFMLTDWSHKLPGSPKARRTQRFIKNVARGMMSQGVALDQFLKHQTYIKDFIRLSIHNHHPRSGKFAIDLFNKITTRSDTLRSPWHHVVLFDSKTSEFIIDHKANLLATENEDSVLLKVHYKNQDWFFLKLYFSEEYNGEQRERYQFNADMIKNSCGMVISYKDVSSSQEEQLSSDIIDAGSITNIIKEFGILVLRGFRKFTDEEDMVKFYEKRTPNGLLKWEFGVLHKVIPDEEIPGSVNSYEGLPLHFDMIAPPRYMGVDQSVHKYEDFICKEFLLYCKHTPAEGVDGATTFVDAHGAMLALNGATRERWMQTEMAYETKLSEPGNKESYFGGSGNVYIYPLVHICPWTGKHVLRWWESWSEKKHPDSKQYNWSQIRSYPMEDAPTDEELEQDIRKIVFDERFFFYHEYKAGDQVYINNYTTLHGFSKNRELWRLQAIAEGKNLPRYFLRD